MPHLDLYDALALALITGLFLTGCYFNRLIDRDLMAEERRLQAQRQAQPSKEVTEQRVIKAGVNLFFDVALALLDTTGKALAKHVTKR